MNLLLLESATPTARIDVSDPRLDHVRGVLRAKVGDTVAVGAINGPRGDARVTAVGADGLVLAITWRQTPPAPPALDFIVGTPRPATARKVLAELTTLGVQSVHFVTAGRVDPAYASSRLWTANEWSKIVRTGAEQAFTTWLPEVHAPAPWEVVFERFARFDGARLAPDVYEGETGFASALPPTKPAVIAIGPERGWNGADRDILRMHDFKLVSLGERVLRVELASVVAATLTLAHWQLL